MLNAAFKDDCSPNWGAVGLAAIPVAARTAGYTAVGIVNRRGNAAASAAFLPGLIHEAVAMAVTLDVAVGWKRLYASAAAVAKAGARRWALLPEQWAEAQRFGEERLKAAVEFLAAMDRSDEVDDIAVAGAEALAAALGVDVTEHIREQDKEVLSPEGVARFFRAPIVLDTDDDDDGVSRVDIARAYYRAGIARSKMRATEEVAQKLERDLLSGPRAAVLPSEGMTAAERAAFSAAATAAAEKMLGAFNEAWKPRVKAAEAAYKRLKDEASALSFARYNRDEEEPCPGYIGRQIDEMK